MMQSTVKYVMSVTSIVFCLSSQAMQMSANGQTTASAGSGFWAARNKSQSGSDTWRFGTPSGAETIGWATGGSELDNAAFWPQKQFGPEFKFNVTAIGGTCFYRLYEHGRAELARPIHRHAKRERFQHSRTEPMGYLSDG